MENGNEGSGGMDRNKFDDLDDFFADVESDLEEIGRSETVRKGEELTTKLEQSEHRINKLELLIDVTKALNSTLNRNELLENIIDSIIKLADTDRGFLMLADRAGSMEFRIARDRKEQSLEEQDFTV